MKFPEKEIDWSNEVFDWKLGLELLISHSLIKNVQTKDFQEKKINKGNGHWRDIVSLDQLDFRSIENAFTLANITMDPYGPLWDLYGVLSSGQYRLKVVQMDKWSKIAFNWSPAVISRVISVSEIEILLNECQ